ncbi:MAG: TolC family protein [Acidobacteria bacterium]|nr:MAG: TolC family protein [Acidobacteriota bacterium]
MPVSRIGFFLLPALLFSGPAAAQEAPADPLAPLVAEALEKSPELAAMAAAIEAARARVAPAGALPDPMVELSYENDGGPISLGEEPMTRLSLMARQAFPYPGKQRLAAEVASADARALDALRDRARLSVEAEVRRAAAGLAEARASRRLVEEQEAAWAAIEEVTRSRYAAGMGTQQDVLRTQAERTRLRQRSLREEAAVASARAELRRLLGRDPGEPGAIDALLSPSAGLAVPHAGEFLAAVAGKSPEVRRARLQAEREKLAGQLARRDLLPDFVASAGYMNRGSLPGMWQVGAGVTVPLWAGSKQRPRIVEAERSAEAAAATAEDLRRRVAARSEERLARLARLAEEIRLDRDVLLIQDRLSVEAALTGYRTGGTPFVTVLEALATQDADRRAAVARRAAFLRTLAALEELSPAPDGAGMTETVAAAAAPAGAAAGM